MEFSGVTAALTLDWGSDSSFYLSDITQLTLDAYVYCMQIAH